MVLLAGVLKYFFQFLGDFRILLENVLRLFWIVLKVIKLFMIFIRPPLGAFWIRRLAFDPFPRAFADGKDSISTMKNQVRSQGGGCRESPSTREEH